MTQRFDADALQAVIEDGRRRDLSSTQIATSILQLLEDPVWGKAMGHPVRARILRLMREDGELSPVAAFGKIDGASLGTLAYHFRHLRELGLIELSQTVQRRGAVEHRYRLAQ
jgi:DNA-binding transcriptional ArsR family regulator